MDGKILQSTYCRVQFYKSTWMSSELKPVYTEGYALHCAVQLRFSSWINALEINIYFFFFTHPQITRTTTHIFTHGNFLVVI